MRGFLIVGLKGTSQKDKQLKYVPVSNAHHRLRAIQRCLRNLSSAFDFNWVTKCHNE